MSGFVKDLMRQYDEAWPHADRRTRHWLLVEDNPWPVWCLTAAYIGFVLLGPRVMRDRKPLGLQSVLVVYNLGLVALSVYMFTEIFLSVYDAGYDMVCASYSAATAWKNPKEMRVAKVLWWYFFSKAIELLDTVFMILRKKTDQVTFLHVFHHASMLNIWWWSVMFIPGGMSWFGSWLNCLVHIVMYLYYGLSAIPSLRGKLWWKRYITRFQLVQFVITFSHTANSLYVGCEFPKWGQYLLTSYMVLMLILFGNFYIRAYIYKRRLHTQQKPLDASSTSSSNNGHSKHD